MRNFFFILKSLCGGKSANTPPSEFSLASRPLNLTFLKPIALTLLFVLGSVNVWGEDVVLFHETFGNNTGSARVWNDSYSVKSGVSAVYSGIKSYTISNVKQGKNTTGSTQSGLNQSTQGTDAYLIIGPLSVSSYESLKVSYQWKAASIKGTYTTSLYYATSSTGEYTEVSGTGTGATGFVERNYSLPEDAQVSTLFLKVVWNTSNSQAIIDEFELTGVEKVGGDTPEPSTLSEITITATSSGINGSYADNTFTQDGVTFSYKQWCKSTNFVQAKASQTPSLKNTTAIPGIIKSITVVTGDGKTARAVTVKGGTSAESLTAITAPATSMSMNFDFGSNEYSYFSLNTPGNACYFDRIIITYEATPKHELTFGVKSGDDSKGSLVASVGGSAISSGDEVEEGATVTLTPSANDYYQVKSVDVLDEEANEVTVTGPTDGKYTFTMPTSNVEAEVSFEYIPVTSVTLNKTALALVEGEEETLSVTEVLPTNALGTVSWSSDKTGVAIVDVNGKVTAVAEGSATITATSIVTNTVKATCTVTVSAPSGNPVSISQNAGGSVVANIEVVDVLEGASVILTAIPDAGYSVSGWTIVGVDAGDLNISADKTTCSFDMPNSEVMAEASFTHEEAVLKLSDAAGVTTYDAGNTHYWKESVTLPSAAATCSKTFMGWSADADRSTAPEIEKGANYSIPNKGENILYAVYADVIGGGNTNVAFNAGEYATAQNWTNATAYTSFEINGVTFTAVGGGNNGKYYNSNASWRFYSGGSVSISATSNILSVSSNPNKNFTISGTSASFAGAAEFKSITVTLASEPSYSGYTTSCQPVLDAPEFEVAEGTYYESTNVTITAADGSTIYYVINEDEITAQNRIEYTGSISLSEYGANTIKAYAVKDGFETSEVAEATYTIGKTFASVSDLFAYLDENSLTSLNNVKVSGLVSQIKSIDPSKYVNGQYYISDNGQQENELYLYNGKYINGADFTVAPACPLEVGDAITVIGNYTENNTRELAQGNFIVSRTAVELESITIGGTASKTAYSEEDNIFATTGLTATATYNTGYEKDVTAEATWTNDLESNTVTESGDVVVTAAFGGKNNTKTIAVTYTTKTVKSLSLSYSEVTTYVGHDFLKPTVTASYEEDIPDEDVTESVTFDEAAYNGAVAGTYTIAVSYKGQNTSYKITVKAIANDQATAYTAAEINDIIANSYKSTTASTYDVYVKGIVVANAYNTSSKSVYYISADGTTTDQFYIYDAKYFDTQTSATGNVKAGDEVIVKGKILYYQTSTPELKSSTVVYQLREANFAIENVAEMEVNITGDLAVADLDVTKDGNGEVTLVSGNEEIATIVDGNIHAVGAGDVTITANLAATANDGSINYKANSTTFNVHVIAERTRYSVAFDANGANSGSAPEAIANQLEGATVTLPECTFSWEKHGFTGWKVINLSTSAEIDVENNRFTMPAANVKIQAQWEEIATTHIVFNVNGNTETVSAIDVPQAVAFSITQVTDGQNGYEFVGWAESEQAEDVKTTIETIDSYTPQAGEASKTLYAVFKRVDEGALKTDVLTIEDIGVTATSYTDFNNIQKTTAAIYAGKVAKNGDNIQLKSKDSESGIISTVTGGVLKSVTINVASGSNTIDVYGSNTAYNAASDLYATGNNANQGTKIGSTSTTNTINAVADYKYVGIRSNSGAIYLSSVEITWQPKTTYYTTAPSAVYAVSYALGGGAWAENEGCDGANVKAGKTFDICESVPVRDHYKFNGWKVGDNTVSGTITIDAATVITANWVPKVESNITYNAGTGTGDDAIVANNEEGAEIVLPSAADKSLNKTGYDFVGWLYNGNLYKAGQTFEMPASAVTFVAQWKKQNSSKMTLVTNANQLVNGSQVIFVNQEDAAIAGNSDKETDTYMVSEIVSFNEDKSVVTSTGNGIVMTLVQVEGGWAFKYNNKYLAPYSGNKMAWYSNATAWEITFDGVNAKIVKGSYAMRYNKASNAQRFAAYSLTGVEPIQLYASLTAITDTENPVAISDLGYVEGDVIVVNSGVELEMNAPSAPASITVKDGATVTISAATEADNLIVENGGKVTVSNSTTVNDLFIGSTMASGKSGQIDGATNINFEAVGDVYFDLTLGAGGTSAQWHAFTVPFPVDALNGVYDLDGNKLTNEVNYAIMDYHGDIRANGDYGWKKYRGILQPGTFYLMTVDGDRTTYRFKKVAGADIVATNSISYAAYQVGEGEDSDKGWNGIGNPTLFYGQININVQVLNPNTYTYELKTANSTNFVVGTPFFYQATTTSTISMGAVSGSAFYAPKRQAENEIKDVEISFGNEEFKDHLYISAREEATNNYEIGKDLAKMMMTSTPSVAQIYGKAYNTNLCMIDAPLVNDQATYKFTLYAPAAGEYTIAAPNMENVDIYLTKDDAIIWNISEDGYTLDMQQGFTTGYGLLLQVKAPEIATDIDNLSGNASCVQKVVIDDHVYILRGEKMYDTTGKIVK